MNRKKKNRLRFEGKTVKAPMADIDNWVITSIGFLPKVSDSFVKRRAPSRIPKVIKLWDVSAKWLL